MIHPISSSRGENCDSILKNHQQRCTPVFNISDMITNVEAVLLLQLTTRTEPPD